MLLQALKSLLNKTSVLKCVSKNQRKPFNYPRFGGQLEAFKAPKKYVNFPELEGSFLLPFKAFMSIITEIFIKERPINMPAKKQKIPYR